MGASYKDLVVWQRAVELSLAVYKLTASFPESERFGLTNQLRRASVSIASNIAEGLDFGKGPSRRTVEGLSDEVSRMLVAIMKKLQSN